MCGLAGFYPKRNKKVDLSKLYALWVANEERGTHSCGIVFGQNRYVGTHKESKARDHIKEIHKNLSLENLKNVPIIVHTRHATNGAHNQDNAHPFQWYREKEENYFSFAHNGSLKNLENYKKLLKMSEKHHEKNMVIDSHVLGLAMYDTYVDKLTEEEVLTTYEGAAAFLCCDHKNVFKVWKGANNNIEERPLYYLETSDGWYFSSLKHSFLFIDASTEPIEIPNNTLITFKDYSLYSEVVYYRQIKEVFPTIHTSSGFSMMPTNATHQRSNSNLVQKILNFKLSSLLDNNSKNIFNELPRQVVKFNTSGLLKGRYTLNDKPLDGNYSFNYNDSLDYLYPTVVDIADGDVMLTFQNGCIVHTPGDYKLLLKRYIDLKYTNKLTYQKIFESMKNIESQFVNLFPFFNSKGDIDMLIFRDYGHNLNYLTISDKAIMHIKDVFNNKLRVKTLNNQIILEDVD